MTTENTIRNDDRLSREEEPNRKKIIALVIVLLLLLIGLATCVMQPFGGVDGGKPTAIIMPALDGNAEDISTREDLEKAMQQQADANYFSLQINPEASLSASTKQGTFEIVNPLENAYPISVELRLDDGTLVYSSGGIMPGKQIRSITTEAALTPGTYSAYASVSIYNDVDHAKEGETQAKITLTVTE